jgi:signal peptidase I
MIWRKNMKKNVIKEILSWVLIIVIAFLLAKVINKYVLYNVSSPTDSMDSTFLVDEKVAVLRPAYLFSKPNRGDIVVFPAPDEPKENYIKRIIGLPGETIEGINGKVYIDGKPLKENYLKEPMKKEDFGPFKIPKGNYFMMGDNRNISLDARYWEHKYVPLKKIEGRAIFKYHHFRWFKRVKYNL